MSQRRIQEDLAAHIPWLRRYARLLVGRDAHEADDLVQETLLRAIRSIDRFREGAELRAWLTAIMVNAFRSDRRRAATRRAWLAAQPGGEPATRARQVDRLEVQAVARALAALPPEQREAVALVALGDVRYADAAKALNLKLGTFMSRIARGRAALRRLLDGNEGPPGRRAVAMGE